MPTSGTICADAGTSVPLLHNDSPEKLERGPDGMRKPKASGIRCGCVITSTHKYVYCGKCMDSWQRYFNIRYVEQDGHQYICRMPYKARA